MAEYVLMLRFFDVVSELAVTPSADVFGSSHLAKMTYKMAS